MLSKYCENTKKLLSEYLNNCLWNSKSKCPQLFEDNKELQELFVKVRKDIQKFEDTPNNETLNTSFEGIQKLYAMLGTYQTKDMKLENKK